MVFSTEFIMAIRNIVKWTNAAEGVTGPTGPTGPAGNDGAQGLQGLQGIQGPAGPAGNDGAAGTQGIQGIQGPAGNDGAAGSQGIQGPAGNDGAQGIQGIQGIQGPAGPTAYTLVASLASNQATGANVTPVDLTGLVFTYAANSKYRIHIYGAVTPTAATTGCGFQFNLSTAVTAVWLQFLHQLANTGTKTGGCSVADDASQGVSSGMPAATPTPVTGEGILITGANTGTAQLRFRSETTAVTTCLAGTTLVVEKIA